MNKRVLFLCIAALGFAASGARAQLPDLQVSGLTVTAPLTLTCGSQAVTFTVTETNASATASAPFRIDLLKSTGGGFTPVCRVARRGLRANTTRTSQVSCVFYNGPCDCLPTSYTTTFQVSIDSLNEVIESDETNNLSNLSAVPSTCP
ncbi:MAG TPA: CARDB domain-containing protein [Thermoanaerobaculia bacterium]|nr:CARDB domain-containing protein [Thermoanaerobaculia bacterium]